MLEDKSLFSNAGDGFLGLNLGGGGGMANFGGGGGGGIIAFERCGTISLVGNSTSFLGGGIVDRLTFLEFEFNSSKPGL